MSLQPAKLLVSVGEREVRLRIAGRANFTCGPDFKNLTTGLLEKGYRRFIIEMSECVLMDSTFLGLLCGLALRLRESGNGSAGVELLNANPRVAELLESLGVTEIIAMGEAPVTAPDAPETAQVCCAEHSRSEMTQTSLDAHQTLRDLNSENAARFKDVVQFLAEDLKRLKSAGS